MRRSSRGVLVVAVTVAAELWSTGSSRGQDIRKEPLPLVHVIATGGTIAGRGASPTSPGYKLGVLQGQELVDNVPEIKEYAEVKIEQLFNVASLDLR